VLGQVCKEIEIAKLTHHDMRHLFATGCVESRVKIPKVSRWLDHKDGIELAMKAYSFRVLPGGLIKESFANRPASTARTYPRKSLFSNRR
jgi:hypothetical protein